MVEQPEPHGNVTHEERVTHQNTSADDPVAASVRRAKEQLVHELEQRLSTLKVENRHLLEENEALVEIGQIVSTSTDMVEVYEECARHIKNLIPHDYLEISILNTENNGIITVHQEGEFQEEALSDDAPLNGSLAGDVIVSRRGRLVQAESISDLKMAHLTMARLVSRGLHSFLCVPLVTRDKTIGCIFMAAGLYGYYEESHMQLVERVGVQIAGAIANSRLDAERDLLKEQLIHAQKMEAIGRLAGGVAHDFNNLLTPILGYSQVGLKQLSHDDPSRIKLQRIYEAAERAKHLVRQLLTFSRKDIIEPKVMSLSRLVVDMDSILRRLIRENIELITRPKGDLGLAKMDGNQMEQVLVNLVVNARDALPDGGRIIIETEDVIIDGTEGYRRQILPPGPYVQLSVRDNGTGMTEEIRARIFEPFFTTKEIGEGTGLGLSTCYGIVNQLGGCINVDSVVGQGSTFTVYLPLANADEEADDQETLLPVSLAGDETILLVEDELAVREIACYVLREHGYTVLEAANGTHALGVLQQLTPGGVDLLLTDVVMPGIGGRELADTIREMCPDVGVVYISGYINTVTSDQDILEDGAGFLQKPFRPEELALMVRETLDKRRLSELHIRNGTTAAESSVS